MDQTTLHAWLDPLPGVSHDIKWQDDLVYMVAGKMFAVYCFQGKNHGQISFKVEETRFLELTDQPHVIPAPYMARAHWVSVLPSAAWSPAEFKKVLLHAYQLVRARLPKKTQRELGAN
ncbi:hypothetical protein C7S18_09800 [Ahniella affigens]|uniref:MmcQ/YjbR family DNA-binding protein n=1 Tax=Ahniella affigens TaxID=2021234 RepID=A0A2P1PZ17_9GAMM|nr:MmcQ/YjbR family DNA-binding protein [Ahniella affigens]AVQ00067.1 hypothetical protein C7S18_09800 [Ahniella affigens]